MPLFVMGRETIRQLRSVRNGTHPYNGTQSPKTTHLKHTRAAVNSAKNRSMTLTEVWEKGYMPTMAHRMPEVNRDTQWVRNQELQ